MAKRSLARRARKNPMSHGAKVAIVAVVLVAAVGGGAYYYEKHKLITGAGSITLAAGAMTVRAAVGATLTISLPAGANWTSIQSTVAADTSLSTPTSGPLTYSVTGAGVITVVWADSTGVSQTTTLTISNT